MAAGQTADPLGDLLNLHYALETEYDDGDKGNFLFGWQCENPFASPLISATRARSASFDSVPYIYLEEDAELANNIKLLHQELDGHAPLDAFCGAGATALLITFCAFLRSDGIEEVYFIPPIYFSMHFALRLFGIRARPVSSRHPFEQQFSINLPEKRSFLILTDPTWYAGVPVPGPVIDELRTWQQRTGSTIFVDGSFQYMRWDGQTVEVSATLDPSLTLRLISPSKSLCVAGYRFAYVLTTPLWRRKISHIYTNIYASASIDTIAFGHEAICAMGARNITTALVKRIVARHNLLRSMNYIESTIQPECGYFVFEKIKVQLPTDCVNMGGEFFDQPRYKDYSRINLLSPSYHLIEPSGKF